MFISLQTGRVVPIENIGSHALVLNYHSSYVEVLNEKRPATLAESSRVLWREVASDPTRFADDLAARTGAMFRLSGGRWLTAHGRASSFDGAARLKALTHLLGDVPFAVVAILAPLGWALAPGRKAATLVALWIGLHLTLTAAVGYSGPRFRAPVDPQLMGLAACALAGLPLGDSRWRLVLAGAVSTALALILVTSVPRSFSGRAAYGIGRWIERDGTLLNTADDRAGFFVHPAGGAIELHLWRGRLAGPDTLHVSVAVEGRPSGSVRIQADETSTFRHRCDRSERAYVELKVEPASGTAASIGVALPVKTRKRSEVRSDRQ